MDQMVSLSLTYHLEKLVIIKYCALLIANILEKWIVPKIHTLSYMDKSNGMESQNQKNYYYFGDFVHPIFLFKPKCIRLFHILMMIVQGGGGG